MVAAGCLIQEEDRLLVVRDRASHKLSFPAGYKEERESAEQTAERETLEEAGVSVVAKDLLQVFDNQFALFRCMLLGSDSESVRKGNLPLPPSAENEVVEVLWIKPSTISATEWRFPEQYSEVLALFKQRLPRSISNASISSY